MADDVVIRAEGLGKRYQLGHAAERERYVALRDVLARGVRGVLRRTADMLRGRAVIAGDTVEEFWALRDVSFEVRRGAILGIIGRNGAGKSTLLKILSRITEPSEGRVTIRGRVASLLEVGTGFHSELTGRENIYLNGAILGMTGAEIRKKFDEIVAFAEVERFLDTPVKRYSSGMYVRLAFAVAAHLEPEILVIDEVLAVGDAEFQNKCLGKMDQVTRRDGRTVLFVSHNMGTLTSICSSAMLLDGGRVGEIGATAKVVESYLRSSHDRERVEFPSDGNRPCITAVSVDTRELRCGNFVATIEFDSPYPLSPPIGGVVIANQAGMPVWASNGRFHPSEAARTDGLRGALICTCPRLPLMSSRYSISVRLGNWYEDFDNKRNVLSFQFRENRASALRPEPITGGSLDWPAVWEFEPSDERSGTSRLVSTVGR
jgi:lipopolysaccharide transport system ATP-binding protein